MNENHDLPQFTVLQWRSYFTVFPATGVSAPSHALTRCKSMNRLVEDLVLQGWNKIHWLFCLISCSASNHLELAACYDPGQKVNVIFLVGVLTECLAGCFGGQLESY